MVPLLITRHHAGAVLRLYRCPDCGGTGEMGCQEEPYYAGQWMPAGAVFADCATCDGRGQVEVCVECGMTFATDIEDGEPFTQAQLYTDAAGRCWARCAQDRFCAEIAAWPYTPEQLLTVDYRRELETEDMTR